MARPSRLFAFRLALAMHRLDVDAMLAGTSQGLLAEWQAFERLEPFGSGPQDFRDARLYALLACRWSGKQYEAADFRHKPVFGAEARVARPGGLARRQTPQEMQRALHGE